MALLWTAINLVLSIALYLERTPARPPRPIAMHVAAIDSVSPSDTPATLPLRLDQTFSAASAILMLLPTLVIALALYIPACTLTLELLADPSAPSLILQRPRSAMQVALGLILWTVLLGLLLRRAAARLGRARIVEIEAGSVRVTERGLFGRQRWAAPLASYLGVAHHVRATLSGSRHEVILVHPVPRHSVLLRIAPQIAQAEIGAIASLLGQREISPRALYRFHRRDAIGTGPRFGPGNARELTERESTCVLNAPPAACYLRPGL